jgi:hypothetical protein
MYRTRYFAAGLVLSVLSIASTASAQTVMPPTCTDRSQALSHLAGRYAETPIAMGLAANGSVLEVLTSNAGESWSILVTMPTGQTSLIASGENWEKVAPQAAALGPAL